MVASLGLTQESFEKEKQALQEQKRLYEAALRQVVNKVANTVPSLLTNYIWQTVPHFLLLTSGSWLVIVQEADLTDKLAAKEKAFQKEKQLAQHLQQADAEMQKEVMHELPLCLPPSARPPSRCCHVCVWS